MKAPLKYLSTLKGEMSAGQTEGFTVRSNSSETNFHQTDQPLCHFVTSPLSGATRAMGEPFEHPDKLRFVKHLPKEKQ